MVKVNLSLRETCSIVLYYNLISITIYRKTFTLKNTYHFIQKFILRIEKPDLNDTHFIFAKVMFTFQITNIPFFEYFYNFKWYFFDIEILQ